MVFRLGVIDVTFLVKEEVEVEVEEVFIVERRSSKGISVVAIASSIVEGVISMPVRP
jgi:hypothetical protein